VIEDPAFLATLPDSEYLNGLAEVVKHGAISDAGLFKFLESHVRQILDRDPKALERMIANSITIKMMVVKADELEAGERRKLNFGHTFGHGLESVERISHGQGVAWGMRRASRLSEMRGLLSAGERRRIENLLDALGLDISPTVDLDSLFHAFSADKKRQEQFIWFVFLEKIGKAVLQRIPLSDLERALHDLR